MTEESIFSRNVPAMTSVLSKACVGVAGCGGLGSNAAVALVRSGVGHLILVDFDQVELSNLNRQYFFREEVGLRKVQALASRLRAINPEIQLTLHDKRLQPAETGEIFHQADLLIEAFDQAEAKLWLIDAWCRSFPTRHLVGASGLAGFGRTSEVHVFDGKYIHLCGDFKSDLSMGLCGARVALVAAMQANLAVELLMEGADDQGK